MTHAEYIQHLEQKLNELKPKGQSLLNAERDAFFKKDEIALRQIRKESDIIFTHIRRTEEDLMIAKTLERTR